MRVKFAIAWVAAVTAMAVMALGQGISGGSSGASLPKSTAIIKGDGSGGATTTTSGVDYQGAQMPRAGLVAEYTLDQGYGTIANNSVYPAQPNWNLLGTKTEQVLSSGVGVTITNNYAQDRNGIKRAMRAVCSGGSLCYLPSINVSFSNVPYTLSFWVKSNTGSTQSMRMFGKGVVFSSDLTVTTSWTLLSYTFTPSAGTGNVGIMANDAAADALDIVFSDIQLELGSVATPYLPKQWHMEFGTGAANLPAWTATGLDFTPNSGASYAQAMGWSPINLRTVSMYAVVQQTNLATTCGLCPILSDPYGAWTLALAGNDENSSGPNFAFGGTHVGINAGSLKDGATHTLVGTYDGATMKLYLDGNLVNSVAATIGPKQITQLFFSNFNDAAFFPGTISYAAIYSIAHSAGTVASNLAILSKMMSARGVTVNSISKFLVWEGDSITAWGQYQYPAVATPLLSPVTQAIDFAVSGSAVSTLTARSATVDGVWPASSTRNVLFVLLGANDLHTLPPASDFVANLKAYCLARKAAKPGLKIVIGTVLPNTTVGFNAVRNTANTLIKADPSFYDGIADFAADATMGCDACASNTTYYYDGTHPTTAGHAILGPIAAAAVQAVL